MSKEKVGGLKGLDYIVPTGSYPGCKMTHSQVLKKNPLKMFDWNFIDAAAALKKHDFRTCEGDIKKKVQSIHVPPHPRTNIPNEMRSTMCMTTRPQRTRRCWVTLHESSTSQINVGPKSLLDCN
jgi:hypothetical protein